MSLNINRVQLAGNLTRDPQTRSLANERSVANFGLAINRRYKTKDGETKEGTTFVDIEAWGRTAELVGQYLTKGSPCFIEGSLRLDQWEDKDGQKRSKLKVVAESVQFIGGRNKAAGDGDAPPKAAVPASDGAAADGPPF